jgi:D-alanyl-D-alanine carboxypeptidase (penicillin-binding protein 5/6)
VARPRRRALQVGVATAATVLLALGIPCASATDAAPGPAGRLPDPYAGSAGAYLVRIDGAPLWAHAPQDRRAPASLTKLMSALIVVAGTRDDDVVTVSARAAAAGGARIGLVGGTRMRAGDLLAAMLMRSANDACLALAEHVAGTEAAFVARMNELAASLRLPATRFANACGFDAPGHVSSASDLARLADLAMAEPRIARRAAQPSASVTSVDRSRAFRFDNTNALIGRVPGAVGLKTGYTRRAGHCLLGVVERDGVRVTVVLLGARDRWWDAVAMIEQAFEAAGSRGKPR